MMFATRVSHCLSCFLFSFFSRKIPCRDQHVVLWPGISNLSEKITRFGIRNFSVATYFTGLWRGMLRLCFNKKETQTVRSNSLVHKKRSPIMSNSDLPLLVSIVIPEPFPTTNRVPCFEIKNDLQLLRQHSRDRHLFESPGPWVAGQPWKSRSKPLLAKCVGWKCCFIEVLRVHVAGS